MLTTDVKLHNQCLLEVRVATGHIGKTIKKISPIPDIKPIEITKDSKVVSLSFLEFVSYSVTNEAYEQYNKEEVSEGSWFRLYTKSDFLDYIKKSTWVSGEFTRALFHFQIITLDHTVNIVTPNQPSIREDTSI